MKYRIVFDVCDYVDKSRIFFSFKSANKYISKLSKKKFVHHITVLSFKELFKCEEETVEESEQAAEEETAVAFCSDVVDDTLPVK